MKLFLSEEIKDIENNAVTSGLSYYQMMRNAGEAVAEFSCKQFDVSNKNILILCGKGNNGGDGFVVANYLSSKGANVTVLLTHGQPTTELASVTYNELLKDIHVTCLDHISTDANVLVDNAYIIIDAIFGFSFYGEISGYTAGLISYINTSSDAIKISVDIPSGVICNNGYVGEIAFKADYTITFSAQKPCFHLFPAKQYCGSVVVAPVGINKTIIDSYDNKLSLTSPEDIRKHFTTRDPLSNKGNYGRLLMICGSYGMIGACLMAAKAALRCGVGLLNIAVTNEIYKIIAPQIPEAIFTIIDRDGVDLESEFSKASAIICGCGLGIESEKYVRLILDESKAPVIFDADALNYLSTNLQLLNTVHIPIIITPHPGEMSRLTKMSIAEIQEKRLEVATNFSAEHNLITVLKGSGTIISDKDGQAFLNETGNSGMAKGGSGDVLAGIIGSFAAQGFNPIEAAKAGVYLHGRAGDMAALDLSEYSMLSTDLINYLPKAFIELIG